MTTDIVKPISRTASDLSFCKKRDNDKFWSRVKKGGNNECWSWIGNMDQNGYGLFFLNGVQRLAHRVSFLIHNGSIDRNLCVLHSCDNPSCVNPSHLRQGTQSENMVDAVKRKRFRSGEMCSFSKLNEKDVSEVKRLRSSGLSMNKIAKMFSVSQAAIWFIISGRNWKNAKY